MELHRVTEGEMIQSFELVVVPEIREHVRAIKDGHGRNWEELKLALKEEYFMEDSERVTKRTFLEWVAKPKEGFSITEIFREFERRYAQLTRMEKATLDAEKIDLFLQAAGKEFQEKLELLLEDKDAEQGLKTDWNEVEGAVSLLAKRQRRRDKMVVNTSNPSPSTSEKMVKPTFLAPKLDESVLDELVKGMRDLKVKLAKLEEKGQPSGPLPKQRQQPKEGFIHRCIWCDSTEHARRDCDNFSDALRKDVVFFKDGKIHLRETGQPLRTNFGKGGMQTLVEDMIANHVTSSIEGATYGVQIEHHSEEETNDHHGRLWPDVMELVKKGKLTKEILHEAGDCIRLETGWNDPVDSMSVHAYITNCQNHEAIVEEKRRRENADEGPSKRPTRSGATPSQMPPSQVAPSPEVTMEESTTGKKKETTKGKPKSPAYKLQSDIELATDLKKVLEERILNSKVEFTLGEVLGIAKREFHEEIIDIIKRKRQTLGEAVRPQAEGDTTKTQGVQVQAKEDDASVVVGCYQSSRKVRQVQFADEEEEAQSIPKSHYSRSHWARATTETLVKEGDLEQPFVALIDHGSEINIMSKSLYNKCKWPIDTEHGWRVKVANNSSGELYAACPSVKVTIGDVKVEQNFFIQDTSSYLLILGQPYIVGVRMETKVMDDGSAYARIRSKDGKRAVQFLTVCVNHERNRDNLREHPLPEVSKEFRDHREIMDFCRVPL